MSDLSATSAVPSMRLLGTVVVAILAACPTQSQTLDSGARNDAALTDSGTDVDAARADSTTGDRIGLDRTPTPVPCDHANQALCVADTACQWLGTSCEPVATSTCGALDWTQCTTTAGCHWFYRDGTGHMPDDPDCTCDPLDLDCSCVLSCDVQAHWNTAGDACLDSAEQPVSGLCCAVMTSYCVEDRPCPEYETPKRCGNDRRCVFVPINDQFMPGYCTYRPDAG